jgi:hypothetical protein
VLCLFSVLREVSRKLLEQRGTVTRQPPRFSTKASLTAVGLLDLSPRRLRGVGGSYRASGSAGPLPRPSVDKTTVGIELSWCPCCPCCRCNWYCGPSGPCHMRCRRHIKLKDHGTLRSMLDCRMPAGTSRGLAPPAISRLRLPCQLRPSCKRAMIDRIWGSSELAGSEHTRLEDTAKNGLLEGGRHVNPSLSWLG